MVDDSRRHSSSGINDTLNNARRPNQVSINQDSMKSELAEWTILDHLGVPMRSHACIAITNRPDGDSTE